jgi:hypothetical protein
MNERLKIDRKTYQFMEKRHQQRQTMDLLIERKEWVPGGMKELLEMMMDSYSYFDSLIAFSCYQPLSCHQYSWALGYTLASMWVMAYNARIGAIEIMCMKDYNAIQHETFHLASKFKTARSYSYQIVHTTDIVDLYVKYLRKDIIPAEIDSEDAVLFPSWKGTPLSQGEGSKKISNIFQRYGYNLSITRLRAMISTHIEERFKNNEINLEEYQRFVTTGQTHTMATHKKYYAKKRKLEEGHLIQESYEKIFPIAPPIQDNYDNVDQTTEQMDEFASNYYVPYANDIPNNLPSSSADADADADATPTSHRRDRVGEVGGFGCARTDINDSKRKYDWIDEEIDYLVEYIEKIAPTLPGADKNRYATCLSFLKRSAPFEAIQFFHPHHLQTSDRLKNGYLRALHIVEEGREMG